MYGRLRDVVSRVRRSLSDLADARGAVPLTRYGRETTSVFDLLGRGEVDLTAALGWTMAQSPLLMAALWKRLGMPGEPGKCDRRWRLPGPRGAPTWS